MKRKFTYFAAFVLSMLMAAPVLADEQSFMGTGDAVTEPVEGQYYVIQGNAQHDNIVSWLYDNNGTFAATATGSLNVGPESMKYVWTFEVTDDGYAAKNLTTGRYIYIEGTSNNGKVKMRETPAYFSIEVGGDYVGFKNASNQYIDMGYSGVDPCTWNGGVSGSRRMTIFVAEISMQDDLTIAKNRLNDILVDYEGYKTGTKTFDHGDGIGQYNYTEEQYNFFIENIEKGLNIVQDEIDYELEDVLEVIDNIQKGYNDILATFVKLTIANGNYRIVSALEWTKTEEIDTGRIDENDQPIKETVTTHPTKAMYALLNENKAMWDTLDETDCRYLWQLTNVGNSTDSVFVQMMNIATDAIMDACSQSSQATLRDSSETKMYCQYISRTADGKVVIAMKPSSGGDNAFLHCNGHGGGTGNASNIVGWSASAGASNWILEPVSDDVVAQLVEAYDPIRHHEKLVAMFNDAISETEAAIAQAKDESYIVIERSEEGLITDTLQFSSPHTDPTEGSFGGVLDNQTSTYWHSTWQDGDLPMHSHYFDVAFTEPIEAEGIQCYMLRRNVANDHITALGVFGSNGEEGSEWTEIGTFNLSKNASNGKDTYSNALSLNGSYKTLRFYIDGTTNSRGYGHFATFQLYKVISFDGNTQWSQMGEAATAIETALATAKEVDQDDMDKSDYTALKEALDAFKAVLVDPSALAEALAANEDVLDKVAVGEAPGFWNEGSDVATFAETLKEASDYLKNGAYTQEQINTYAEAIKNGASDIYAAANPIEPGKWYAIKFDSEENYDKYGWSKAGPDGTDVHGLGALYDNYAAPANIEKDEVAEGAEQTYHFTDDIYSLENVTIGQGVRFIPEDNISQMDMVAFRFVEQGDSAFAIQHKSGLYLNGAGTSTTLTLGLTPALFNVRAIGYGKVVIEARKLNGEGYDTDPVYLHAQRSGHSLVTWYADGVSTNSALFIEPIDESEFDEGADAQEGVVMNVKPNSIQFMCYPAGFSVEGADIYAYQGAIADTDSTAHYAFNKIEQAEPGQPVLLVVGDREDFVADDEEEDPEQILISIVSTDFAINPLKTGGVHGTYAYEWVDEGTVVVYGGTKKFGVAGNALVLAEGEDNTDCTRDISANTGYIVYEENILKDASIEDFDYIITAAKGPESRIVGDLNGDGKVDIADAVTVLNIMAASEYNAAADVNNDGKVDIADFVTILNIMAAQ